MDVCAGIREETGQEQLAKIKNIKKNISIELIRHYLPDGFAEFYQNIMTLGHADRPDYDRLIRILEKGKL